MISFNPCHVVIIQFSSSFNAVLFLQSCAYVIIWKNNTFLIFFKCLTERRHVLDTSLACDHYN